MLGGQSEQGTTTGPQISANERENMEPSVELSSQLRVAVVDVGKPDDIKDCSQ